MEVGNAGSRAAGSICSSSLSAMVCAWLRQVALWILAGMQYTDDFNPVGGYAVKQGVTLNGEASSFRHELGAFCAHRRLLG